jgi:WD40 repeat protein
MLEGLMERSSSLQRGLVLAALAFTSCRATPAKQPSPASQVTSHPVTGAVAQPAELDRIPEDGSRLVVAMGHQGRIAAIATTPDGQLVATSADDRITRVFRADGLRELARFFEPGKQPQALALSADGSRVAVGYRELAVIYDVASSAELGRVDGVADSCLAFDGNDLLLWRGGLVRWRAGTAVATLSTSAAACEHMGLVGPTMLVVHDGRQLHLGELGATTWAHSPGPPARSDSVAFGPGVVAWSGATGVDVWRTTEAAPKQLLGSTHQYGEVTLIDGGSALVHVAADVTRVTLATGATSKLAERDVVAGLGNNRLATGNESTLCIVDSRTGATVVCRESSTGPVRSLAATQDGLLVVGADRAPLLGWSLGFPTELRRYSYSTWAPRTGAAVLAPDGKLTAQIDGHGIVVRPVAGDQRRELSHQKSAAYDGVAWSPDGTWIATIWRDSIVRVRAGGTGHEIIRDVLPKRSAQKWIHQHGAPDAYAGRDRPRSLVFRGDGAVLAIAVDERVLLIRGDKVIATLAGPTQLEPVTAIAFRPGTNELAVGFADGHVRSWNTEAPATPIRDRVIGAAVAAIAFDASGTLLVSSDDARVRVFGATALQPSKLVETRRTTAVAVAFLSHGRIATGHLDGVVRIFRLASSELTAELFPLDSHANGRSDWVVAGHDGRIEASLEGDGLAFYGMRLGQLVPFAEYVFERRRVGVLEAAMLEPAERPRRGAPGPEVVAQTWTQQVFHSLVFTPDGKELIGNADEGVYAFDVESGLLRTRLGDGGGRPRVAVSNGAFYRATSRDLEVHDRVTGRRVATQNQFLGEIVGRTPTGEIVTRGYEGVAVFSESPLRKLRSVAETDVPPDAASALSPDGTVIATTKHDGTARLFTTATLQERPAVRCAQDNAWKLAVAANGAWIACATQRGNVVVTRADGKLAFVVRPDPYGSMQTIYELAFHPTKPLLAVATLTGGYIYDVSKQGTELRLEADEARYNTIAWSPAGDLVAMSALGGSFELFDATTGARLREFTPKVAKVDRIGRARPGVLVLRERYQLRTWDAATGHERPFDGGTKQYEFAWTADGSAHVVDGPGDDVIVTDATGASVSIEAKDVDRVEIAPDGKRVFLASSRTAGKRELVAVEVASGKRLWAHGVDASIIALTRSRASGDLGLVTSADKPGKVGAEYQAVVVTAAGRVVASHRSTSWITDLVALDGERWLIAEGKTVTRWNTRTGATEPTTIPAAALAGSVDNKRIVATSAHELHVLDANTVATQASASVPNAKLKTSVFLTDDVIATLVEDGTVMLWTLRAGKLARAGQLIAIPRRGTVLVSPEGYYMAEAEAASALGFALGPQVFRFEQFDGALNRPHLALGALGVAPKPTLALYQAAYEKRQKRRALEVTTATRLQVPTVELVEPLPLRASTDKVTVKLRAEGRRTVIARVNVRVNGVPLLGRTGMDTRGRRATSVDVTQDVPLEIGINRIELEAENEQGVLALGRTVIVTREGTVKPGALHVISIGVSKYAEGNNLQYAAKDADDVAKVIAKLAAKGTPVTRTLLRDEQVKRDAVLALRKQLEATAIEDTVVMFVAGHGLLDADDQYIFATHDVSFESGARGIRFAELEGLLDGIPARRKILMIDTCHAGELDAEELAYVERVERSGKRGVRRVKVPQKPQPGLDPRARAVAARELFTELRRGAGVTVLAASAGAEYSYEDSTIKNGLFSRALIDGLERGKADHDHDGAIRVTELLEFLTVTVSQQSQGFQVPQARELNRDLDFDLTPGRPHATPWTFDKCIGMGQPFTSYQCGALIASAGAATPGTTGAAALDKLAAELAFGAHVKVGWTDRHGLAGVKLARKFTATVPGYRLDAHVGWIAVDAQTQRVALCVAIEALPLAVERCKRVMSALLQARPPLELP